MTESYPHMPLTDTAIKAFKPEAKARKYADGQGLHLMVQPTGGKLWRFRYRHDGKEKMLSLGVYPDVSLKAARILRDEARELLAQGIDPSAARQEAKAERIAEAEHTFEKIAREWYGKRETVLAESTRQNTLRMLEKDVLPWIGGRRIDSIEAPDLLDIVKRIERRGAKDVTRRCMWMMGRVFRYGVAHGFCMRDPSRDIELGDVLEAHTTRNLASQTDPKATMG